MICLFFVGRRGRMAIIKWNTHLMICLFLVGRRGRTAIIKWKRRFHYLLFLLAGVAHNASLSGNGEKHCRMQASRLSAEGL